MRSRLMIFVRLATWFCCVIAATSAATVTFKQKCLSDLVAEIPGILASQNQTNGRFGKGIWIVTDQNVLLPLAVAWAYDDAANPFHHRADVLDAIVRGGDALIAAQDKDGRWLFEKKDGSTWGQIYMPWTYSRWIRSYQLVRDALKAETRTRWDRALTLGFTGIAREVAATKTLANIPTHHAMSLYFASQVFARSDWEKIARDFLHRAIGEQHADGYWSEHSGPVINYGFVYLDAIGTYAAASHDPAAIESVRRAVAFHAHFTYPNGSSVETVDERNPFEAAVRQVGVGGTLTPEGRAYFAHQLLHTSGRMPADAAAPLLILGEEGESADSANIDHDFDYRLPSGNAAVRHHGSWFLVASAFTAPLSTRRWIQDRQNLVSVYHTRVGLILGGGNTKLQPRWSNFTAGDIDQFFHRAGDENPKFTPPAGVVHIATHAQLLDGDDLGLTLDYAGCRAEIRLHVVDDNSLDVIVTGDRELAAHLTLMPRLASPLRSASHQADLRREKVLWDATAAGSWLELGKVRIALPLVSDVRWPVLPHNPYRKDGHAENAEGRIVISAPMDGEPHAFRLTVAP